MRFRLVTGFFCKLCAGGVILQKRIEIGMDSILIRDTTREERIKIINKALNSCGTGCENCSSCWLGGDSVDDMYQDYIDGKREIAEINREYSERFACKQRR